MTRRISSENPYLAVVDLTGAAAVLPGNPNGVVTFLRIPMIRTTDSEGKRPLIPIEGGHLFRVNPATLPNRKQC